MACGSWVSFSDLDGNNWLRPRGDDAAARPCDADDDGLTTPSAGLTDALRQAAAAHGKHEEEIGRADPDWPDWYAHYVVDERTGQTGGA